MYVYITIFEKYFTVKLKKTLYSLYILYIYIYTYIYIYIYIYIWTRKQCVYVLYIYIYLYVYIHISKNIPDNALLVTADVVGLYPSIPHKAWLRSLKEVLGQKTREKDLSWRSCQYGWSCV